MPQQERVHFDLASVQSASRATILSKIFEPGNELRMEYIPTGFPRLDGALGGGLTPGLTCLGAVSGVGKTTLAMQIAAQIAGSNRPVIVFSLEMSRNSLAVKELSRQTYLMTADRPSLAKDYNFLTSAAMDHLLPEERAVIEAANDKAIEQGIYVVDTDIMHSKGITANDIDNFIDDYLTVCRPDKTPVVIVDYLQIMPSPNDTLQERQAIDKNVGALRLTANNYHIPVIMISALNRESYADPVSLASFKGSGGIEYQCDTVLALQMSGIGIKNYNDQKTRCANPREVDLVVLKQRNGPVGITIPFRYYCRYSHFEETIKQPPQVTETAVREPQGITAPRAKRSGTKAPKRKTLV